MKKNKINPLLTGTLFPDGVPVDYMIQSQAGKPFVAPTAILVALSAIKHGYNVIYINLEQ